MFTQFRYTLIACAITTTAAFAQTVKVTPATLGIKGEQAEGFEVILDGKVADVKSQFENHIKPLGKTKRADDADVISLPLVNGKNYTSPIYVAVRDKGTGAAWMGIKASEWSSNQEEIKKEIEKIVYDFGVVFYKNKIQVEIDESLRALQAVERQQQRLQNQNKDLNTRLGDNKNEKIQLEKSLENNKVQFESLTKKIEQNKKEQDSVAFAGEQIKKMMLLQKDRQAKVN